VAIYTAKIYILHMSHHSENILFQRLSFPRTLINETTSNVPI